MENFWCLEELLLTTKLRTCGGTVSWFCCRGGGKGIGLFRRTAQAAGRQRQDGREVYADMGTEELAEHFDVYLAERYQLTRVLPHRLEGTA